VAKLIYASLCSLDGYVADQRGNFDWARPVAEVHAAVNDIVRRAGTQLYGRRMYDVLVAWETMETAGQPAEIADFAEIWHSADKVVYSRSLERPSSARTRVEREFDPDEVRRTKDSAESDLTIGGPELAGQAIGAGLVDEIHLFLSPVVVGGGTRVLPEHRRVDLDLLEQRRFANGVVQVHYAVRR
jgi:dihydrofolate reductase